MAAVEENEDDGDCNSIVIENGSSAIKAGFGGDDAPKAVFQNAMCLKMVDKQQKICFGDKVDAHKYDQDTESIYPVQNGIVTSWDPMEKIWNHTFRNELCISPQDTNILLTESALNPKANREKSTQILFETFNFKAQYLAMDAVMALYASGRTSGQVVDCGYQRTQLVPVWEGYALPHAISIYDLGGYDITKYLEHLLLKGHPEAHDIKIEDVRNMKQQFGYVANKGVEHERQKPLCTHPSWLVSGYFRSIETHYSHRTSEEIDKFCNQYVGDTKEFIRTPKQYKLPDGKVIELKEEQFECTEVLFNPKLLQNVSGLHCPKETICDALLGITMKIDVDLRGDLFGNTVLAGRGSMFEGFKERLHSGIAAHHRFPTFVDKLKIIDPPTRRCSAWIGGSILASLSTFQDMWISQEEYTSSGPSIVHRKCF